MDEYTGTHALVVEIRGQIEALRAHSSGMGPAELTVRALPGHTGKAVAASAPSGATAGEILATLTFATGRPAELVVGSEALPDAGGLDYESATTTTVSDGTLTTRTHIVLRRRSGTAADND